MKTGFRSAGCVGVLILSMATASFAAGAVSYGAKGGLAISNVSPSEIAGGLAELQSKKGPTGGLFATWNLSDVLGVQGELLYVSKGFSLGKAEATDVYGNSNGTFEALVDQEVLEIPVLLHASLPTEGRLRPALVVGPAVSIKLRERLKFIGAVEGSGSTDYLSDTGFGVTAGAELRIRAGSGWSLLEARYTYGVINIADNFGGPDPSGGGGPEEHDRTWMFMAGYAF